MDGSRPGSGRGAVLVALAALVAAVVGGWSLCGDGRGPAHRVETGGRELPAPPVSVLGEAHQAVDPPATSPAGASPQAAAATPTRRAAQPAPTTPATVTTAPVATTLVQTSTLVPAGWTTVPAASIPPTSTTAPACRNSTDSACGPFRFDPQPGPDRPMTVQVGVEPAAPRAGQEVVFRVTLTDPDGVSYNATVFGFGDAGIAGSSHPRCEKFGAWEPPAPDVAAATEVQVVRHTYANPGTYAVSFAFEAGPFACVDSVTGRGDRPYASSATGAVTVVVV